MDSPGFRSQALRSLVVVLAAASLGLASVPAKHDSPPQVDVPANAIACPPPARAAAGGTCADVEAQARSADGHLTQQEGDANARLGGGWETGFGRARDLSRDTLVTVWTDVNDGPGSGLDADRVDGISGEQLLRSDRSGTLRGDLTVTGDAGADGLVRAGKGFAFPDGSIQDSSARVALLAGERVRPGTQGTNVIPPTIHGISGGPGVGGLVLVEAYREYAPGRDWGCSETWLLLYNTGHHGAMWNTGIVIAHSPTAGNWACDAGVELRGQNGELLERPGDWTVGGVALRNVGSADVTWRVVMWR